MTAGLKPYTYQDLADLFGVTVRTIRRWWKDRRKFNPTPNTVRITQDQLDLFVRESCKQPKRKTP